jgi:hypothetical protein
MNEKLQALAAIVGGNAPDALMLAGAGAISYGAGMIYPPLLWIVGGALAIAVGMVWAGGRR